MSALRSLKLLINLLNDSKLWSCLCPHLSLSVSGTMPPCGFPVPTGKQQPFTAGQGTQLSGRGAPFLSVSLPAALPTLTLIAFWITLFFFPLIIYGRPVNCLLPHLSVRIRSVRILFCWFLFFLSWFVLLVTSLPSWFMFFNTSFSCVQVKFPAPVWWTLISCH